MYNENLKLSYIEERNKEVIIPNNYLNHQFEKVSIMEEELGKDVSNFTVYEIMEYYKYINTSSYEYLQVLNSQLNIYTQWCLQKNIVDDNQDHYIELTKDMLLSCVNRIAFKKSIIERETIYKWIDELPNPKDKFILLFLFEIGKSKNFKDIFEASMSDINNNIMKLSDGRNVIISDKLKSIAFDSYTEDTYYSISGKGVKKMPLVNNKDRIVKGYPNVSNDVSEFQKGRVIYNAISRMLKYFDVMDWCTANSIVESGKIDMIKSKSLEYGISPMEFIYSDHIKEIENQYGYKIVRSMYFSKYEEYLF